jgi:putative holliday junction resolvase
MEKTSWKLRWSPVAQEHDQEHEHGDDDVIVLTDEEGNEHEFSIVQVIKVDEKDYAILLPLHDEEEEEEAAVILRIDTDENEEDILVEIENEEEFERVAEAWEKLLDEEDEEDE